jgi:arylsulfatase A-like enzyme
LNRSRSTTIARIAAAGIASLLAAGCGAGTGGRAERPNLVLISIDTLRADHLGCYGYSRDTSPNLDRLALEGVLFEHAYAPAPWTLPSHASLFTGLYPAEHGVVKDTHRLDDRHVLLPEALAELGYRSAAIVSTVPYLRRSYGFKQGWVSYDDRSSFGPSKKWAIASNSEKVYRGALKQLDQLGKGPFFLFVHDYDVHANYVPPAPFDRLFGPPRSAELPSAKDDWRARRQRELPQYDGEIRWVDDWIGKLVEELRRRDLLEHTVIAVVADHGEEFFEHGFWGHGANLFDSVLHVPWIVRFPGARHAGTRIAAPVSLVDVPATLLALAGSEAPRWRSGRDVGRWLGPGAIPDEGEVFAFRGERNGFGLLAVVSGGYKALFRTNRREIPLLPPDALFRVGDDPDETISLAELESVRVRDLRARGATAIAELFRRQRALPPRQRGKRTAEEEEGLRALGYL